MTIVAKKRPNTTIVDLDGFKETLLFSWVWQNPQWKKVVLKKNNKQVS